MAIANIMNVAKSNLLFGILHSLYRECAMKLRKQEYGDRNMVGRTIERMRKEKGIKQKDFISRMQTMGCDINPTSFSKLEGQVRAATDRELYFAAKILGVRVDELYND